MADFKISDAKTSKFEGKYKKEPEDSGDWTSGKINVGILIGTNWGISAPVLKEFLGRMPTESDMRNLSQEDAQSIRKKNYWDAIKGDQLLIQSVADSIYDSAINLGVKPSIKIHQKSWAVPQTGKMDEVTLNALNNKR